MASPADVTQVLNAARSGDRDATTRLMELVYDELRRLARHQMAAVPPGDTLQPTALVHEAYLRLLGREPKAGWENRAHFFNAAARAMRDIIVEQARKHARIKHGGDRKMVTLDENTLNCPETNSEDLLALDEALEALEETDPKSARIAMLRYFAGLTVEDTAEAMQLSTRTVKRRWQYALAWLDRRMFGEDRSSGDGGYEQ
ncbi:MAG: sigma-70 family RNA polymerase sigma factor [Planctomycetota bacterium]|jgi:RNA polymerase sigma factor (TIGR02999 family)